MLSFWDVFIASSMLADGTWTILKINVDVEYKFVKDVSVTSGRSYLTHLMSGWVKLHDDGESEERI